MVTITLLAPSAVADLDLASGKGMAAELNRRVRHMLIPGCGLGCQTKPWSWHHPRTLQRRRGLQLRGRSSLRLQS
jgi:hypothetical protein